MSAFSPAVEAALQAWGRAPFSADELTPPGGKEPPAPRCVHAAYREAMASPVQRDSALVWLADLLPTLPPLRAALLATFCGALVEDGADARTAFIPTLDAMAAALAPLSPFLAIEPDGEQADDDADPEMDAEERAHRADERARWQAAQSALAAQTADERLRTTELQQAVEQFAPPLMTMLMRSRANHEHLLARKALVEAIDAAAQNDTLPMDMLFYLQRAALLSYEDEVAVVLPETRTGALVRVHAVDSTFHALALLQGLIADHAEALALPAATRAALREATRTDQAQFHWLADGAFAHGQLKNAMAWAWGEPPLRALPRRGGRVLLYAADIAHGPRRSWNGFGTPLHDAQNAHAALVRLLTADEVTAYLDEARA